MMLVEHSQLNIEQLSQAIKIEHTHIIAWVEEGLLSVVGSQPADWQFTGDSFRRAKLASNLYHSFEINPSGIALAIDLLDQLGELQKQLEAMKTQLK